MISGRPFFVSRHEAFVITRPQIPNRWTSWIFLSKESIRNKWSLRDQPFTVLPIGTIINRKYWCSIIISRYPTLPHNFDKESFKEDGGVRPSRLREPAPADCVRWESGNQWSVWLYCGSSRTISIGITTKEPSQRD